ncbi:MAG: TldD/PmbA family protein [Thermoplasmata archaeon]|nr:TldD/PmbA family protein [Thermoplasmata archaeon]
MIMEDHLVRFGERLGADYVEIRREETRGTVLEMKNGMLEKAISASDVGYAIRVLASGRWGFSSANREDRAALEGAVAAAVRCARSASSAPGEEITLPEMEGAKGRVEWKARRDPEDMDMEGKHSILAEVDGAVRDNGDVRVFTGAYSDGLRHVRVVSSLGMEVESTVVRTVIQGMVVGSRGGRMAQYRFRIGGTRGLELFDEEEPVEKGREASEAVSRILDARAAPAGRFPVVADPALTGVFIHEALGHGVEGDIVSSGGSVFTGRLGDEVASPLVSVYDDPTWEGAFGSFPFDDEGLPARKKTIIERGVLRGYILNMESARKLGLEPNGGARAESYSYSPQVRMSNTYIAGGDMTFEELLEDIKLGVYAKGTRGGQVDTARGTFQFGAQEAFLIEDGELGMPLRDVALAGSILDILKNIDGLGSDLRLGDPGFCGKGGQMVPVGDGGPHIRIKEAVVGGTGGGE